MSRKKHDVFDLPIIGYFILAIFGFGMTSVSSIGDSILGYVIPDYATFLEWRGMKVPQASGICVAVGALIAVAIFYLWFKPDFKGMIKRKAFLTGIILLLPVLLLHYTVSIVSWFEWGKTGAWGVFIAFLRAFAPGFGEEITYRGLGVANYMRTIKNSKGIYVIFALSSVVFGLVHLGNVFSGAPVGVSIIQALYATGIGMALGAVYLRTGNLLPCIIGHMSLDFMEFIRDDLHASSGVMQGLGIGDWITIAAGVVGAVWGIFLIRKKYHDDILALWDDKWNGAAGKNTAAKVAN